MKKIFTLALAVASMVTASAQVITDAPLDGKWYRLTVKATEGNGLANTPTDPRIGDCIMLLNAETAGTKNGGQANRLWSNDVVEPGNAIFDYQVWKFEKDPNGGEGYAMVNKAVEGWVNHTPTATNNTARWDYLTEGEKDYGMLVSRNGSAIRIRSNEIAESDFMCMAGGLQNYSINVYGSSSGAVDWEYQEVDENGQPVVVEPATSFVPEDGVWYTIQNKANNERKNRYMAVSADETPQITTTASTEELTDAHLWKFVKGEDGTYAIVNKKYPNGQVNTTSTNGASDNSARFHYTVEKPELDYGYSFPFVEHSATTDNTNVTLAGIRHSSFPANWYFNTANNAAQGYPVNIYNTNGGAGDHGNALVWEFAAQPADNDDTTSISEIKAAKPAVEGIFDIQGRRLAAPVKGINIINGKKVLVK